MDNHKVMVVGIDAATLDLVRRWAGEGALPHFARILSQGAFGALRSTLPAMSPAAWSTFATGTNPGKHGILDFTQFPPDSYGARFTNATLRRGAAFWEIAGRQGVRGGVINVPITYPPRAYNGFMVAGLLAPSLSPDMVTPREAYDDLIAVCPDYRIDVDMVATSGLAGEAFLQRTLEMTQRRLQAALGLYRKHRPPLFVVTFVAADRACHYYWAYMQALQDGRTLTPAERRLAGAILTVYRKLDEALGALLAEAGEDTDVLILSDHGAGPLRRGLNLAKALAAAGLLAERRLGPWGRLKYRAVWAFARLTPQKLKSLFKSRLAGLASRAASTVACADVDYARSRAYPTGQSQGVFVNLRGRQPRGIVEPADYEAVRDEILAAMRELADPQTGQKVFQHAYRREEAFTGPAAASLPDVILEQADYTYDIPTFSEHLGPGVFYDLPPRDPAKLQRHGGHVRDGLLMAIGPRIRRGEVRGAQIADVPATVLALLGCKIPEDFDGRVLTEMLLGAVEPPAKFQAEAVNSQAQEVFSEEDQAALKKRLEGLGYL